MVVPTNFPGIVRDTTAVIQLMIINWGEDSIGGGASSSGAVGADRADVQRVSESSRRRHGPLPGIPEARRVSTAVKSSVWTRSKSTEST